MLSTGLSSDSEGGTGPSATGGLARIRWAGVAALAVAVALLASGGGWRIGEGVFDLYQRLIPRDVDSFPARIVEIDDDSLARYGRWPWPRSLLARLTRGIVERGALAVGFDMVFAEPDRNGPAALREKYQDAPPAVRAALAALPDPDRAFAATIARLPVVLGRAGIAGTDGQEPEKVPIEASFTGHRPPAGLISFPRVISSIPALDAVAAGHAVFNGPPDPDGVVRRVPLVVSVGGRPTPTLSLEVLRVAIGADGYRLKATGNLLVSLTLGDRTVPTAGDGRIRPYFTDPVEGRLVSAAAILDGTAPRDAFQGTVVLVGATALGLGDIVATPLVGESPGVDVHAQMVETILAGAWLNRPDWALVGEVAFAVLLGLLAVGVLPRMGPVAAISVSVAAILVLFAGSAAAFAGARLLLDPSLPGLGAGFAALAMLCMMFVEADRRRRALRTALDRERVNAARLDGELRAAREIQIGMLPSRAQLGALPPAIEVEAALEAASSVGGDLYDAFMLDSRRLFFMIGDVTGKGVPASLFMALSKALTRSAVLREAGGLEAAVEIANGEISRENPAQLFVTAVLGVLDLETGQVEMVNAGHEAPCILRAAGGVDVVEMEGGPPLCVLDGFPYPVESTRLEPGDLLLITTDGVTEARDPSGALFGTERLIALLNGLPRPARPNDVIAAIEEAVHAFEADQPPTDDLTLIAVAWRGVPAAGSG